MLPKLTGAGRDPVIPSELRAVSSISSTVLSVEEDAIVDSVAGSDDSLVAPSEPTKHVEAARRYDAEVKGPLRKWCRDADDVWKQRDRAKCLAKLNPRATPTDVVMEAMNAMDIAERSCFMVKWLGVVFFITPRLSRRAIHSRDTC